MGFMDRWRDATEQSRSMCSLFRGTYFTTLGVPALIGRPLTDEDDRIEGNHPVAVVSYGWWKRSLALDSSVLGKKIKLGETTFNIVGVAPPEFFGTKVGQAPDVWVPLSMMKQVPPNWEGYNDNFSESLYVMGGLKPGVSMEQAITNVNLLYRQREGVAPSSCENPGRRFSDCSMMYIPLCEMKCSVQG